MAHGAAAAASHARGPLLGVHGEGESLTLRAWKKKRRPQEREYLHEVDREV